MRNSMIRYAALAAVFALNACGGGNSSPSASAPAPAPKATLSAASTSVNSGATTTLTWTSTNATACQASGGWSGALAATGSQVTVAITTNTTFSIVCSGAGGSSSTVSVTVNVVPTATLSANPTSVTVGGTSTLSWTSTNATACQASGGWSGALASSGSKSTGTLSTNTTYSLTCTGAGGTSSAASAQVSVSPPSPPVVTFSASPPTIASGSSSVLTWSVSGVVTSCTASGAWTGFVASSGSQSTGPLTANSSYSLICTGPGGTSPIQTVAVAIAGPLSPKRASIAMRQTAQFSTTLAGAVIWSVDGVTSGNTTVGTVSATGLYTAGTTAPVTAGLHSVLAVSATDATQAQGAVVAVTDLQGVYTYHNDASRDGANTQEYALAPANVNTASFGKLTSCPVDGAIYAQPLWIPQVSIGGVLHNVVVVATQNDGFYAFDADAVPCVTLWSVSLIDVSHGAAAAGEVAVPSSLVGSNVGDIAPTVGVTGTPVIDPATNIIYVVSKSMDSGQTTYFTRLHAINLLTGNEQPNAPVLVAGTYPGTYSGGATVAFDSHQELQRAGLGFANGNVYVAFGSHADAVPWFGWLMTYKYSSSGFTQTAIFNASPNLSSSGIWMSGGAPSFDSANNAYVVTGNGTFDVTPPNKEYGDTLLQLPPSLTAPQYFRPDDLADPVIDNSDNDFGAGGATMLADLPAGNAITHALVCGGKDMMLMVLNRDALGGYSAPVQSIPLAGEIFSTAAFSNNNLYIASWGGALQAFTLNTTTAHFTAATSSTHTFGFPGATPSVSSAGTQGGVVWSLDTHAYCTTGSSSCGPVVLYAHDAGNLTTELWNSGTVAADAAGNGVKFSVPTVANGHVYVGTRGNDTGGAPATIPGELEIYGLKP